jgi:hypothetical protein
VRERERYDNKTWKKGREKYERSLKEKGGGGRNLWISFHLLISGACVITRMDVRKKRGRGRREGKEFLGCI